MAARTGKSGKTRRSFGWYDQVKSPRLRALSERLIEGALEAIAVNAGSVTCPQESASSRLKIFVYAQVRRLFADDRQDDLQRLVLSYDTPPRTITFDRNPYYWALFSIYKSDEISGLTSNSINVISWQLLHAHNHEIEPELLIGFIYQTAASGSLKQAEIKRIGQSFREEWFSTYRHKIAAKTNTHSEEI